MPVLHAIHIFNLLKCLSTYPFENAIYPFIDISLSRRFLARALSAVQEVGIKSKILHALKICQRTIQDGAIFETCILF